jgi:ATP adenylyltransferase
VKTPQDDDENLVLWRIDKNIVILNRFPYNNGHLLIAPLRHIGGLEQATNDELLEMIKLVRESQKALTAAIKPHGFNIGMNFGRCAGAGLPDHLHIHIVPRWDGDTNFMSVCSDTKVISQSLTELLNHLKQVSKNHNFPRLD